MAPVIWMALLRLATDGILAQFSGKRGAARERYRQFVAEGIGRESIWKEPGIRTSLRLTKRVNTPISKLPSILGSISPRSDNS